MRYACEPHRAIQLYCLAAVLVLSPAAGWLAWWAWKPIPVDQWRASDEPEVLAQDARPEVNRRINASVFEIDLWSGPPPEVVVSEEAPPEPVQPRLPVELLAITTNGRQRFANFYDTASDAIVILSAGGVIQGYRVTEVSSDQVRLERANEQFALALENDR